MSKNNDYTTRNLLDYFYHQDFYKIIFIRLSLQKIQLYFNTLISQEN